MLRDGDDFDRFVIQYLEVDDRMGFLMESVADAARSEKNFYLYHMYQGAVSENKKLRTLIDWEIAIKICITDGEQSTYGKDNNNT